VNPNLARNRISEVINPRIFPQAFAVAALTFLALPTASTELRAAGTGESTIQWREWSDHVFEDAKKEHRFVLLDLGAGWCHWCHVMEEITYHDDAVMGLIRRKYLAVHVDADSRPDLANRYEDYGWPATIVFNDHGGEIVKRRGYIPPKPMASLLQAIIDDPSPGPSVQPEVPLEAVGQGALTAAQRNDLRNVLVTEYDPKNLGWGTVQKFLDWEIVEYCMQQRSDGRQDFQRMARETLTAQLKLIDPVWGGVYQYSTDGDWDHPHFEKVMQFQGEDLRMYSQAYAKWKDPKFLAAAGNIHRFLKRFLRDAGGAFYTSQDADVVQGEHSAAYFSLNDSERLAKGVPRVDRHIYARENGWAITGLVSYHAATGDSESIDEALQAANWVIAHRSLPGGGFRHGETDVAGPYMGDTVSMARAFMALYQNLSDRIWLQRAADAVHFVDAHFKGEVGYLSSAPIAGLKSKPQTDENTAFARLANLLYHYTGTEDFQRIAKHAMRCLAAPSVIESRGFQVGGILLADEELSREPAHITIVGRKDDPAAVALYETALRSAETYRRIEWWDKREGPMLNTDVTYPELPKACAFVCKHGTCSAPLFTPEKLAREL